MFTVEVSRAVDTFQTSSAVASLAALLLLLVSLLLLYTLLLALWVLGGCRPEGTEDGPCPCLGGVVTAASLGLLILAALLVVLVLTDYMLYYALLYPG